MQPLTFIQFVRKKMSNFRLITSHTLFVYKNDIKIIFDNRAQQKICILKDLLFLMQKHMRTKGIVKLNTSGMLRHK
jgi:hypothetical protein